MALLFIVVYLSISYIMCQEPTENKLLLGSNFPEIVKSGYYVDKSLLVKTLLKDSAKEVFVMAPRKFGKTLNLQMLKHFLELKVEENGLEVIDKEQSRNFGLFKELEIYKEHVEFFDEHFGEYPVVHIDYSPLENVSNYAEMQQIMMTVIEDTFRQHKYLLHVDDIQENEVKLNQLIKYTEVNPKKNLSEKAIVKGFSFLTKVLYENFGKCPIILIDNYDCYFSGILFQNNSEGGKIVSMFQKIQKSLFKQREKIEKIFCTGVLYVRVTGTTTYDKDLETSHFLRDHVYAKYYGMREDELTNILQKRGRNEDVKDISKLYNGYTILRQKIPIYNIFSVMQYLTDQNRDGNQLKSYFPKPKSYKSFLTLFRPVDVKLVIINLLENKTLNVFIWFLSWSENEIMSLNRAIHEDFKEVKSDTRELIIKLLVQHGYMALDEKTGKFSMLLRLPNSEIKHELESILFDSVIEGYGFDPSLVEKTNDIFDEISTSSDKEQFKKLFNSLQELIIQSNFNETRPNSLLTVLIPMLRSKFNDNVRSQTQAGSVYVTLRNVNNVSIVIVAATMEQEGDITNNAIQNCTQFVLNDFIGKTNSVHVPTVHLGVCLGIERFERTDGKVLGINVSTKFDSKDNIISFNFM